MVEVGEDAPILWGSVLGLGAGHAVSGECGSPEEVLREFPPGFHGAAPGPSRKPRFRVRALGVKIVGS